eukprot:3940336-Rhodomonas_salina.3
MMRTFLRAAQYCGRHAHTPASVLPVCADANGHMQLTWMTLNGCCRTLLTANTYTQQQPKAPRQYRTSPSECHTTSVPGTRSRPGAEKRVGNVQRMTCRTALPSAQLHATMTLQTRTFSADPSLHPSLQPSLTQPHSSLTPAITQTQRSLSPTEHALKLPHSLPPITHSLHRSALPPLLRPPITQPHSRNVHTLSHPLSPLPTLQPAATASPLSL